jgi:hypothetical protein
MISTGMGIAAPYAMRAAAAGDSTWDEISRPGDARSAEEPARAP